MDTGPLNLLLYVIVLLILVAILFKVLDVAL